MGSDRDQWPLSAYIMDPIRAAMVVSGGPARILEVVGWLRSAAAASLGLSVSDQERLCAANGGMLCASERIFQKAEQNILKLLCIF